MLKQALMIAVLCLPVPASSQTIHVYGPGGPLAPMKECAQLYTKRASLLGTDALEPVAVTSDPRFPSPRLCVHAFVPNTPLSRPRLWSLSLRRPRY
jgi:hypothetical protein